MKKYLINLIERLYLRYCLPKLRDAKLPGDIQQLILEKAASESEGLVIVLRLLMEQDKENYFVAAPEAQEGIKGAYRRTAYLLNLAQGRINKGSDKTPADIEDITRYGK